MKRKGWISSILGLLVFLLSYLFSIANNTWQISLFRASMGFLLFFALGFFMITLLQQAVLRRSVEEPVSANPFQEGQTDKQVVANKEDDFESISLQALHSGGQQKSIDEAAAAASRLWMKESGGDDR